MKFFIHLKHVSNLCWIGRSQQCLSEGCLEWLHETCFRVAFTQLKSSHEISTSTELYCWPRKIKREIFFHSSTSLMDASFPSDPCWNYDIFLSFRGEDVRKNFLGHLYSALNQVGFRTYKDDNEFARGSNISPSLQKAIEHSRIAIVLFSKNYADSGWCLDELVKILDCRDKLGQIVLPIFFHVDPSDVRKQRGSFGEAFTHAHHQKVTADRVEKWKTALTNAANLAGFDLQSVNSDESELIKKIIEDVRGKLHHTRPSKIKDLFGIDFPVKEITSLLRLGSKDVRFIGIYGMPGIGKTTVAEEIRNEISKEFEGNSLLMIEDDQLGSRHGRLVELQERLLCDILGVRELHLRDVNDGIEQIRGQLKHKKVLIILDNVDCSDQLEALANKRSWFGAGSRIMITCRDEHLLDAHDYGVDAKYEVPSLHFGDAKRLFSWHAFREHSTPDDYANISHEIVRYAGGHPLSLKVLGAFLYGRTLLQWTSALEKLKSIPHGEIMGDIFERLKICYDSLDEHQKAIFLDIAFFFVGMDQDSAIQILDGCGFAAKIDLYRLIEKCLLTIREKKLRMHDLLQEMAREIVHKENPGEPGKRSRLSFYKDVRKVLKNYEGTNNVVGLQGFFPKPRDKRFSVGALALMKNVRILQVRNADFVGGWEHFSKELRWLCWERCPWLSIPTGLNLKKLVVLRLCYSKLKYIWEQTKVLKNLKVLDLSHSHDLIKTSDISGLLNIEKLIFRGCINLIEVHHSIGNLSKLMYLDLENCQNLVHLPTEICKLRSLENLNLYLCSKLEELPEDIGKMETLKELNIGCTTIKRSPMSIGHLWSSASLKFLNLSYCNLSDNSFPQDLGCLPNIERLHLTGNTFHCLPSCLSQLQKLKDLDVSECDLSGTEHPMVVSWPSLHNLNLTKNNFCSLPVDLHFLPYKIYVNISGCKKLQAIEAEFHSVCSVSGCTSLKRITFKGGNFNFLTNFSHCYFGCGKLVEVQGNFKLKPLSSDQLAKLERLFMLNSLLNRQLHLYSTLTDAWIKDSPIQGLSDYTWEGWTYYRCPGLPDYTDQIYSIFLPEGRIPNWFNHQNDGGSIVADVPEGGSFQRLAVCVVYCSVEDRDLGPPFLSIGMKDDDINLSYDQYNYSPPLAGYQYTYSPSFVGYHAKDEVMWVSYWRAPSLVNECRRLRVTVESGGSLTLMLKRIGLRLLHEHEQHELDPQLFGQQPEQPLQPPDSKKLQRFEMDSAWSSSPLAWGIFDMLAVDRDDTWSKS